MVKEWLRCRVSVYIGSKKLRQEVAGGLKNVSFRVIVGAHAASAKRFSFACSPIGCRYSHHTTFTLNLFSITIDFTSPEPQSHSYIAIIASTLVITLLGFSPPPPHPTTNPLALSQQSWVKANPAVSTPPANCEITAATGAGPICTTRSACSAPPTSPRPSAAPRTPRASCSRRSESKPNSPTRPSGSVLGSS
jgi:hypothetical protein